MEYSELRELVHIRHELRRFVTGGDRASAVQDSARELRQEAREKALQDALTLLTQMSALASRDPVERESTAPEVERWRVRLGL